MVRKCGRPKTLGSCRRRTAVNATKESPSDVSRVKSRQSIRSIKLGKLRRRGGGRTPDRAEKVKDNIHHVYVLANVTMNHVLIHLRDVRILPFRTSSRYHRHFFTLEQVHTHTSEGIHTPLRVSLVTKIIPEERSKVLGESSFYDRISGPAHHLCLEHQVMLRQCCE